MKQTFGHAIDFTKKFWVSSKPKQVPDKNDKTGKRKVDLVVTNADGEKSVCVQHTFTYYSTYDPETKEWGGKRTLFAEQFVGVNNKDYSKIINTRQVVARLVDTSKEVVQKNEDGSVKYVPNTYYKKGPNAGKPVPQTKTYSNLSVREFYPTIMDEKWDGELKSYNEMMGYTPTATDDDALLAKLLAKRGMTLDAVKAASGKAEAEVDEIVSTVADEADFVADGADLPF